MTEPMSPRGRATPETAPLATTLDGRYRLQELLGQGGMAEVYRAADERLARPVAVKVFRRGSEIPDADMRQRSEIRLLAGLSHPGVVAVYDAGTDHHDTRHQRSYLVMELVIGTTLARRIAAGPLPPAEVADLGAQLASALIYLHARGIVHRDIKPANILLADPAPGQTATVTAKLSDFGIARLLDDTRITTHGSTLGTANYLSPEQATGADLGPPSDVYSLGLVLLECLTGQLAYPGHGVPAAAARLHQPAPIPQDLPAPWAHLLTAMTSLDPAGRPDATHVAQALRALAGHASVARAATTPLSAPGPTQILSPPAINPSARRHTRRWLLAGTAMALLVIALVVLLLRDHSGTPQHVVNTPVPSPTLSSHPTSQASTSTKPAISRPTTPLQAIAALRAAINAATTSGNLDPAAAQDLNNRLNDLTKTITSGKGPGPAKPPNNDAGHKVSDLIQHLRDLANNGQLSPTGQRQLAASLADLERLIPPTH